MVLSEIPLCIPTLLGNERRYLERCVETNFVSSVGPFVEQFERDFASYIGSKHAVACSSGTAAIHIALRLLGVEAHDEVMVADLTFVASANPIMYEKAVPVLVDAEPRTWNMDPALVVAELESRARTGAPMPKVLELVHILGRLAEAEPIIEVCERFGVAVVEDAAESLGARYERGRFAGRYAGTLGKVGCYSFNGNKVMTAGGGGMITTDDECLARRARHLSTQARLPGVEYDHDEVGYNYRLTNVAAAIGLAQLEQLPSFLDQKQRIADRYDAAFSDIVGLKTPSRTAGARDSHWLYTVSIDPHVSGTDRRSVLEALNAELIGSRPVWKPLHLMAIWKQFPRLGGSVSERIFEMGLSLPCSVSLTEEQQGRVIAAIRRLLPRR